MGKKDDDKAGKEEVKQAPDANDEPVKPVDNWRDKARKELYKRHAETRAAENDPAKMDEKEKLDRLAMLERAGQAPAPDPEPEDEQPEDEPEEATAKPEQPEEKQEPPSPTDMAGLAKSLAGGAETVNIRVLGKDVEVTRDEVLETARVVLGKDGEPDTARFEAGVRELAKHRAADQRLETAAALEKRLRQSAAELERQRQEIEIAQQAALSKDVQQKGDDKGRSSGSHPPQDVTSEDLDAQIDGLVDALYTGSRDEAAETLKKVLGISSKGKLPSVDADEMRELVRAELEERARADEQSRRQEQIRAADEMFAKDFEPLYRDEMLTGATKAEVSRILQHDPGRDLVNVAREAAINVAKRFDIKLTGDEPGDESGDVQTEIENRRRLKEVRPSASSAQSRQPQDQTKDQAPSSASYVQRLQKVRQKGGVLK